MRRQPEARGGCPSLARVLRKPIREANRCKLEPFKQETPKTTLYLVLAQDD